MLYQSRPGTLSWFYLGTYESYVQVALAFIEAPPDEELIPEEKKLLFKNYWRQLPKTKEEAKKFYERGLIEDLDLYQESPCILDLMVAHLDISPIRFYQYVEGYLMQFIRDRVEHVRRVRIAKLYDASIEYGMKEQGFKDRNAILQQEGLHFTPKGQSISINQNLNQANIEDSGLPVFEDTVHKLSELLAEPEPQKQLTSSSITIEDIDSDESNEQVEITVEGAEDDS